MRQKKSLDVTTKGWSKDDIQQLKDKINLQNYKWEAKVVTQDGTIKWCHTYTKTDVEIMALQEGWKILKVTRK